MKIISGAMSSHSLVVTASLMTSALVGKEAGAYAVPAQCRLTPNNSPGQRWPGFSVPHISCRGVIALSCDDLTSA
jgi:hypothetical protein